MTGAVRILFVDDEPNVLQGLSRMLRGMRGEWEMRFVDNARAALAAFEAAPFDAVVTDMRMPGMDGAELLSEIRKRYPQAIRVILSGYSEQEAVMRTVNAAHQYLAKPCESQMVIDVLRRAIELRRLLECEGMRQLLAGLKSLPTPSTTYYALVQYMDDPKASANGLAEIIAKDVAMTAELLKLTNSAYFTVPAKVTTPLQAVRILGFEILRALVLRIGIFRSFQGLASTGRAMESLNRDSFLVARIAKRIAKLEGFDARAIEMAFCAGMLGSIGLLVLLDHMPERVKRVKAAIAQGTDVLEAETKEFGASHFQVGAYLLGLWGFAEDVVGAVAFTGRPGQARTGGLDVGAVVHVARVLAGPFPLYAEEGRGGLALDIEHFVALRKDGRLAQWKAEAAAERAAVG